MVFRFFFSTDATTSSFSSLLILCPLLNHQGPVPFFQNSLLRKLHILCPLLPLLSFLHSTIPFIGSFFGTSLVHFYIPVIGSYIATLITFFFFPIIIVPLLLSLSMTFHFYFLTISFLYFPLPSNPFLRPTPSSPLLFHFLHFLFLFSRPSSSLISSASKFEFEKKNEKRANQRQVKKRGKKPKNETFENIPSALGSFFLLFDNSNI